MKSIIVSIALALTCSTGIAQQNRSNLKEMASNIQKLLQQNAKKLSRADRREIRANLRYVESILLEYGRAPEDSYSLKCVSKDDDGLKPWIVAAVDEFGTIQRKLSNTTMSSRANCESVVENVVQLQDGSMMMCGTKDDDGRRPYSPLIVKPDGSIILARAMSKNLNDCFQGLSSIDRVSRKGISFCVSKDNDASRPFVKAVYRYNTESISYQTATYRTLAACRADK